VAPAYEQDALVMYDYYAAGNLWVDIQHESAREAGRPLAAAHQALAKRRAAARAEACRPPLWVVTHGLGIPTEKPIWWQGSAHEQKSVA
jgi:hypothetical protein